MRKLICDKCGREITQGEIYTKIEISRHINPAEQEMGCVGIPASVSMEEPQMDLCTDCTEQIIAYIGGNHNGKIN